MPRTKAAKAPSAGPYTPRQIRFTPADLDDIAWLAKRWGPVKPLDRTAVLREAIRRARAAESKA
jgi:hypothetical protein